MINAPKRISYMQNPKPSLLDMVADLEALPGTNMTSATRPTFLYAKLKTFITRRSCGVGGSQIPI